MRIVDRFPHAIREIEHLWIPLRDGTRLAARLWLPEGAGRVPAVVEYIPYGKRVGTRTTRLMGEETPEIAFGWKRLLVGDKVLKS